MNGTFSGAVDTCFAKYAVFRGRARRAEYWYFTLFTALINTATEIAEHLFRHVHLLGLFISLVGFIISLVLFLPSIAVGVRRLHDVDKSGWWVFLGVVPLVGWIIVLVWLCTRGTPGGNRFGGDPLTTAY